MTRSGRLLAAVCLLLAFCSAVWLARSDDRWLNQVPKRLAQGKELRLEHHMALGFHRAAWVGVVVGLGGAMGLGWTGWRGRTHEDRRVGGVSNEVSVLPAGFLQPIPWGEVVLVAVVAMTVSGALRWPRLGHSFWSDEAYAARAYVWGVKVPLADGRLEFQPVSWKEALFLNERANNQVWCSVEARAAHVLWRVIDPELADTFSERVLRFPSFVWGLLTVAAVTVLGAMLAGRAGLAAGLLLAVHPWHVRFAAEMRGYSAMLFALVLGIIFLLQALRDGRWRWWLMHAAANLWALLAFAGSAHVPLVCGGASAVWLVWHRRWSWLGRLVLTNALAAVVFLWIFGPSITQLRDFLAETPRATAYTVNASWLRQLGESLCIGVPWSVMSDSWRRASWFPTAEIVSYAVVVVAGLFSLRVAMAVKWRPRLLIIPGLLMAAAGLSILQSVVAGTLLLMWYLLPVLIGWVLVLGTGPENGSNCSFSAGRLMRRVVGAAAVIICFGLWLGISIAMATVPRQPMREAAVAGSGIPDSHEAWQAGADSRLHAVAGISDAQMKLYSPKVVQVKSLADLERAEARAAVEEKTLWISVGGWEATTDRSPEVVARLTGGGYERVAELPGWEPMFSYQVWKRR